MIILGHDAELSRWASTRLGIPPFHGSSAIGVAHANSIVAVAVFDRYSPPDIQITFVTSSPRWASKGALRFIFHYPFVQLGCKRITALTEITNQPSRAFLCRLGFKQEGIHPDAFHSGDAVSYGLLRKDCRWLAEVERRGEKFGT